MKKNILIVSSSGLITDKIEQIKTDVLQNKYKSDEYDSIYHYF